MVVVLLRNCCCSITTITKYIDAKTIQAKNTRMTYKTKMHSFAHFVYSRYITKHLLTTFWSRLKSREYDPYDILTEYSGFLKNERPIDNKKLLPANVIRASAKAARKFFRFNKIDVIVGDH
jgi:hypothetical protein